MKKLVFVVILFASAAFAADEQIALKKELAAPAVVVQPQVLPPVTAQPAQAVAAQPVQAAPQPATVYVVEKQATTVVEDAPLKDSKADQLRKQREDVERQTEERIVEKLEGDRVRAEQERAQKIMDVMDKKPEPVKPVEAAPVVAPAPVVVAPPPAVQQVKEELKDIKKEDTRTGRINANLLIGYATYPTASNVKGGTAFGVGASYQLDPQLSVGLEFLYSKFDREGYYNSLGMIYSWLTRVDQYNMAANMKYRVIEHSKLSPYVGGLVSYTSRNFSNGNLIYPNYNGSTSSWAMDAGLLGGVDFALSEKFSVGLDLRYMFNVTYNINNPQTVVYYGTSDTKAIESLNYYVVGVNGILTF